MATTAVQQSGWLSEPQLEFFHDAHGRVESAYLTLRRAKYARAVQPDPEHLVFLYVGGDDVPIGIRMLEPIAGALGAQVMLRLLQGEIGPPARMDRSVPCNSSPMTLEQMGAVLQRLTEANRQEWEPRVQ